MEDPVEAPPAPLAAAGQWPVSRTALVVLACAGFVALRIASVYSVAGNWDEFSLFEAASKTAETGSLYSGGRPGLAPMLLLPLVEGCADEIQVLQRARLIWVGFTLAFLVGLGFVVALLQPRPERRLVDACLAIALLALVPAFLEWSIQVRTDHIALVGGLWGGVALLASRRRPWLSLIAGLCFGIGFLSSQKLFYLLGLMGLLAAGQLWLEGDLRARREALRAAGCAIAFATCLVVFQAVARTLVDITPGHPSATVLSEAAVQGGLSAFDFYRKTIGWSQYVAMLPTLGPHFILLVGLVAATAAWLRRPGRSRRVLILCWAILALGTAVGLFHAAAFYYFWMTLGVFPAIAYALARGAIVESLPRSTTLRRAVFASFWGFLALPAAFALPKQLEDTQFVQRESLDFIHRNFDTTDAGFQPESALFCRGEGQPIRHFFSSTIYEKFGTPGSEENREKLIGQFRDEPVLFLVQSFRLNQFPLEVRRFWSENYQPYRASVFVAGRHLEGGAGEHSEFELLAEGDYRWLPLRGPQPIELDGQQVPAGAVIRLAGGDHVARFSEAVPGGMLVLAVAEPPGQAPLSFYKAY
jgi:hypothetical protein